MENPNYRQQSWTDPRVKVAPSTIEGSGGFAKELIKAGEVVVIIGGTVMTDIEFTQWAETATNYDAIQIGEELHLVDLSPDARSTNGSLNHSCDSNLWMQDEVTLIARRDIQAGEEVTVDYALFTAVPEWTLDYPCACGSSNCRRKITGNDWQLSDVQAKYKEHFSPFLNTRINASK